MKRSAQKIRIALSIAQKGNSRMRLNKTLQEFADEGIGQVIGREYIADHAARLAIRQWLEAQDIDWRASAHTLFEGPREDVSRGGVNEKNAKLPTNHGRIQITIMSSGVRMNGQAIQPFPLDDSFISINPEAIEDLAADYILLVENHRAFIRIRDFLFHENLTRTLAIYRGDTKDHLHGESWARKFKERFDIKLITFPDFDAGGLHIALGARSDGLLLPEIEAVRTLRGSSEDYQTQFNQWVHVKKNQRLVDVAAPWLNLYGDKKKGSLRRECWPSMCG